jgi:adenylate cyclase
MSEGTQRRLAAIVAADVVGYSRLMGVDEAGTLAALRNHRAELIDGKISEHGGRIVKTMGDGLLLEFSSVVDATQCVIDVQQAMARRNEAVDEDKRIVFRIGVHLGDLVVEDDDIFGDGINIAARLEAICEAGGIAISGTAHENIAGRIEVGFVDAGEWQLKNISRLVRIWQWTPSTSAMATTGDALALPDKPSIAVLPFDNMSGDPEQEYFADGIAEDIITALSNIRWFFVTARNSSFTYKGAAVDVKQVGNELGVRYVLEGSVRKAGSRVRVTAQLIEAAGGNHIWAQRYDRELRDIFDLQDEITNAVVGAVEPELAIAERDRATRKATGSLDAWDLYQRGMWHFWRRNAEDGKLALEYFEAAIEMDRDFSSAYAALGWTHNNHALDGWTQTPEISLAKAFAAARRAVEIDDKDAFAHMVLGRVYTQRRAFHDAIAELERALEFNPNSAMAYYFLGFTLVWTEKHKDAIPHLEQAIRQSPNDPLLWAMEMIMGRAMHLAHRDEDAVAWGRKSCRHPNAPFWVEVFLAAPLTTLDRIDEARSVLAVARGKFPNLTVRIIRERITYMQGEAADDFLKLLRKAGLPEE